MNVFEIQTQWENEFDKKKVKIWLKEELLKTEDIYIALVQSYNQIIEYLDGDYYPSKVVRNTYFKLNNDVESCMYEIMLNVLLQQRQTLQQVIAAIPVVARNVVEGLRVLGDIAAIMAENNLFYIIYPSDTEEGVLMVEHDYELPDEFLRKIQKVKYLPPLIIPHKKIVSNVDNQYLTFKTSVIKKRINQHDGYVNLDTINSLMSVELSLDEYVVFHEKETPKHELDTIQKMTQWDLLTKTSLETYNLILDNGNKFRFGWTYDARGRIYSSGYHINYQSTEYKKALIDLPKEVIKL